MEYEITESSFYLCYQRNQAKPIRERTCAVTPTGQGRGLLFQMGTFYLMGASKTSITIRTPQGTCNERQDLDVIFMCAQHAKVGVNCFWKQHKIAFFIILFSTLDFYFILFCFVFVFKGKQKKSWLRPEWNDCQIIGGLESGCSPGRSRSSTILSRMRCSPILFCRASNQRWVPLKSHKISSAALAGSCWQGRENSRAADRVTCILTHLCQKKWTVSPHAMNLNSSLSVWLGWKRSCAYDQTNHNLHEMSLSLIDWSKMDLPLRLRFQGFHK